MPNQKLRLLVLFLLLLPNLSQSASLPSEIKLMTWNVLNDSDLNKDRGQTVLSVLSQAQADILVLQEVNLPFVQTMKNDPRFSEYQVYSRQQGNNISGGLAILSRLPLKITQRYERLPSMMNRGLLYLMLELNEQFLCIANVHLESMMDDTAMRIKQLKAVFKHLSYCDDIILSGDFNFGKGEPEEAILAKEFKDTWLQLNPIHSGLTYDRGLNPLSDDNAFWFEKSRRLDRIYFSGECLKANQIQLTGNQPYKNNNMPSDHFSVLATFLYQAPCQ